MNLPKKKLLKLPDFLFMLRLSLLENFLFANEKTQPIGWAFSESGCEITHVKLLGLTASVGY